MMPDLPNVGWERDIESFREFFENPAFRTDGLKLYPTLVIRGTGLYELWKKGLCKNYAPDKVGGWAGSGVEGGSYHRGQELVSISRHACFAGCCSAWCITASRPLLFLWIW